MNDFHRLRAYTVDHKVWAVFYDLSCIALFVFAFTGVYLWWKLEEKSCWEQYLFLPRPE